ncbi:mycofactocin-coupled SDR family oxidoreductase [Arthrobacter sp. zg-Y820]|uniref:mycofactocin-coupled SDR family oxidoreductase n=1 Tax=unclassified Arthrobacter TaxID=235627 RepID=UPI001E53F39B|nr:MULTISPECIES: mycofactocin-coupled SDR family oxidoreductase [unclassified Arthrobacter]MCC9196866.1 mycofactocin-coupled SDR family oxidoreductase [Arthrobacter sp. zg-Y820]MDK1279730.1 mycofactocin-coupled SDR family oxidoreductase [Arthrobacter sp. zg.Y820]WIB11012.1 mycofactocin-coupled SDR family oxidoreductase [Arthrobacter sp. zg-Y820]
MGRVEGKVAFITGAARGQGRSHAVRLAQEGADIIAVDLCDAIPDIAYPSATEEDLEQTVKEVEALGRRIIAAKADVRDRVALQQALDAGVSEFGHLDVVVANAGIMIMRQWDEVTPEIWQDTISTNLTGAWNTVQLAAPYLVQAGGGSIILTSSSAGLKGLPFLSHYVASKHGVVGLMHAFATELAEHHIRVNSVHPAGVDTPMSAGDGLAAMNAMFAAHPRVGGMLTNLLPVELVQPEDIANAVLFLASDEARYVTSLAMTVDAGVTQY